MLEDKDMSGYILYTVVVDLYRRFQIKRPR